MAIPPYQVSGPVFEVPSHDGDQEIRIGLVRVQQADLLAMVSSARGFDNLPDHRTDFMLIETGEGLESALALEPADVRSATGVQVAMAAAQDLGQRMEHLARSIT